MLCYSSGRQTNIAMAAFLHGVRNKTSYEIMCAFTVAYIVSLNSALCYSQSEMTLSGGLVQNRVISVLFRTGPALLHVH